MTNRDSEDAPEVTSPSEISPVNPSITPTMPKIDWQGWGRTLVGILAIISALLAAEEKPAPPTDQTINVTVPAEPAPTVTPAPASPSPVVAPAPAPVVAPAAPGMPTLKVPAEIKAEKGTFIAVTAETNTAWVNFKADTGLAVFPSHLLSDKKSTVLVASEPGIYKLTCYTGNNLGGVDATTTIIVGTPPVVVTPPVVDPTVPPVVTPPTVKATHVTYVFEKDDTAPSAAISAALDTLNRTKGVKAVAFEDDTPNGNDQVPLQYKAPLEAAKVVGMPALVVSTGTTVIKSISKPTAEQVLKSLD